jgi:hypothetical protein
VPTWGPVTVNIGPGVPGPDVRNAVLADISVPAGDAITQATATGTVTFEGGHSDAVWDTNIVAFDGAGNVLENRNVTQNRLTTLTFSWSWQAPIGVRRLVISFRGSLGVGQSMHCTANGNWSDLVHCAYGSQRTATSPVAITLTLANITSILAPFGIQALATGLSGAIGLAVDLVGLCAAPPGQLPVLNNEMWNWSVLEQQQFVKALMWFSFCECAPGTPAATPYPPPALTVPPNGPTQPTFTCDGADICASIVEIKAALFALTKGMNQIAELTTLVQRYELPFNYISGASHSGLVADGGFALPRVVGLRVEVTATPPGQITFPGNPPYMVDLGWLAILDANGLIAEKRLVQTQYVWLHDAMPTATRFQWSLKPNVAVRVTELYAEP